MIFSENASSTYAPEGAHLLFWAYWQELAAEVGERIPPKSHIQPAKLAPVLPKITMSEYVDSSTQRVILIGEEHQLLWPRQMANTNLFEHLEDQMADVRKTIFQKIRHRPCGAMVHDRATTSSGLAIDYRGLILPFLGKAGKPDVFVGCYEIDASAQDCQDLGYSSIVNRCPISVSFINSLMK